MPGPFPTPDTRYPITLPDGTTHEATVFLNAVIDHPNIEIGDYTYMSDFRGAGEWAARLAPYLFPGSPERLVIGRFCQLAHGVTFVTASANHRYDGISTYPFPIFDPKTLPTYSGTHPASPDTIVGHDCWIGMEATILPGARLGSGVIVGAKAVVHGRVPDYCIVAGNPARVVRSRFPKETVARLLDVAWWSWDIDRIVANQGAIMAADLDALERARAT